MKLRKLLLAGVGVAIGVAGARWASKTYQKAKAECPPFGKRVFRDANELIEAARVLWERPQLVRSAHANPRLTSAFVSRIMLAVTGVNGCRYCSYAHTRAALRVGIQREEAQALLQGDLAQATNDEAPALFFAQHYAETAGEPEADLLQRLVDEYGEATARDILTLIRLIMIGNLLGNTFDALVSRALGKPSPDSTLQGELSVLATALFGLVPLAPVMAYRAHQPELALSAES